jgi:hypothetical protein
MEGFNRTQSDNDYPACVAFCALVAKEKRDLFGNLLPETDPQKVLSNESVLNFVSPIAELLTSSHELPVKPTSRAIQQRISDNREVQSFLSVHNTPAPLMSNPTPSCLPSKLERASRPAPAGR